MKFIHISDLHIHKDAKDNKDVQATLNYIGANYKEHNVIITGDIVDDGHEKQYKNAVQMLMPFKDRLFICPGNHDFGAVGNLYSRERALRFDEFLSKGFNQGGTFTGDNTPVVNIVTDGGNKDSVMLIALDSNLETEHPFDFACGEIGEKQLKALDTVLSNPASAPTKKILFFHHHPFIHSDPFMELKDAKKLARVIYQRVDVVLFGHKHVMGPKPKEEQDWMNRWHINYILASDNSPGKKYAREITVNQGYISVDVIPIKK